MYIPRCSCPSASEQGVRLRGVFLQSMATAAGTPLLSKAPRGNGIGATGSKNWVWFQEPFALLLRTVCPRF